MNGETFFAWVRHELAPTLQAADIVALDNLGSHKGRAVRRAIRRAGEHLLFLAQYSQPQRFRHAVMGRRPSYAC